MQKGTCKIFETRKGWGFLTNEETKKDIFVHVSGTLDKIVSGDHCTWDEFEGKKGLIAINVKRVKQ